MMGMHMGNQFKESGRLGINADRRLVQYEQIRAIDERPSEKHAPLSAGQSPDPLVGTS